MGFGPPGTAINAGDQKHTPNLWYLCPWYTSIYIQARKSRKNLHMDLPSSSLCRYQIAPHSDPRVCSNCCQDALEMIVPLFPKYFWICSASFLQPSRDAKFSSERQCADGGHANPPDKLHSRVLCLPQQLNFADVLLCSFGGSNHPKNWETSALDQDSHQPSGSADSVSGS